MKRLNNIRIEIGIGIIGIALVVSIFVVSHFVTITKSDGEYLEYYGAFVGGCIGSLFSLTGVLLLFLTLKNQRHTSDLQHFETRYYELIKLHRDNVSELELPNESGRKIFVSLMREFRCAYELIRKVSRQLPEQIGKDQCVVVAYYFLFYGCGPNSSRMLITSLERLGLQKNSIYSFLLMMEKASTKLEVKEKRNFKYTPFEGHQSRLGHYYRHLYQMVRYVDEKGPASTNPHENEYMKTIRAQLSTHEQALLLLNSLTPLGEKWWRKNFIDRYRLVRNIPEDFFEPNTEIDIAKLFPPGYFEWQKN